MIGESQNAEGLTKEQQKAVEYFEQKLAYEMGPGLLKSAVESKQAITVVDMRTPELYAASHVPGAINLTLKQLQESTAALNKDHTIIVYAYDITCALSTKAALLLAKQGFAVKELYGNFAEYAAGKYPLEGTSVGATFGQGCG